VTHTRRRIGPRNVSPLFDLLAKFEPKMLDQKIETDRQDSQLSILQKAPPHPIDSSAHTDQR